MSDRVHQVGLSQPDATVKKERIVGVGRRPGDRLRGGVGKPVRSPNDKLFKCITRIKVGGTELFKRMRREGNASAGVFGRIGDGEPQFYAGAEEFAQHTDHLMAELASYPVLSKLAVHREVQLVAMEGDKPNRFDPHLENGLRKGPF